MASSLWIRAVSALILQQNHNQGWGTCNMGYPPGIHLDSKATKSCSSMISLLVVKLFRNAVLISISKSLVFQNVAYPEGQPYTHHKIRLNNLWLGSVFYKSTWWLCAIHNALLMLERLNWMHYLNVTLIIFVNKMPQGAYQIWIDVRWSDSNLYTIKVMYDEFNS